MITVYCNGCHDGDTLQVEDRTAGLRYYIRIADIDAPEVFSPYSTDQNFGRKAGAIVRSIVKSKTLQIVLLRRDIFNRRVCNVSLNGVDLATTLLRDGIVWADVRKPDPLGLKELQATAKAQKLGLWDYPGRKIRPSTWRRLYPPTRRSAIDLTFWDDQPFWSVD